MAYEAMNTAGDPENPERNKAAPRSSFQGHALLIFYIVVIAVSMGGWLWFLGSLCFKFISWAVLH
jgi:hypothetical protein